MYEKLMESVVDGANAAAAREAVCRNRGSAGIDRMTTDQLAGHLRQHWDSIRNKLLAGRYTPSPVRRVEIEKPGGGVRLLGIPTVLDRCIQQMLLQVLSPIFDPGFHPSSYGFRPGRSAQEAVLAAEGYVRGGKNWVVDMDITKFFDHVNHDILMHRIGQTIRDKRVLRLIGDFLRAGVMHNGVVQETVEGTPQGGPLSPLLANIYLDGLDRELERRGLSFCRYADDCNVYVSSERAAHRAMEVLKEWLWKHLHLEVNVKKSGVGRPWERKFLGFQLAREGGIGIAPMSLERFRTKVRELWSSCQSESSNGLRENWRRYVRGWWNYYRLITDPKPVFRLEGWIRRHIRKCFWQRWHDWRGRKRHLRELGVPDWGLEVAHSSRGAWRVARSPSLHRALSNQRLRQYGFLMPSDLAAAV